MSEMSKSKVEKDNYLIMKYLTPKERRKQLRQLLDH
jgi:hypothetical protein